MKKVLVSILALAMMLSCFCTINVFADEVTPTITAIDANNVTVGTYTSISSAASAAGENGKVVLSEGTFEFNGRQGISVNGITLEGAGKNVTFIKTSATFKDGSETNRKALLTIAANNVTVKDLTIDGSVYGSTITAAADFNVVRINSGSNIVLNNIYVTGSPKSLITIGSNSNSATVTATNLDCQATYKAIPKYTETTYDYVYADIDINNGSFTLNSGAVNGFIRAGSGTTFINNAAEGTPKYYNLVQKFLFVKIIDVTTTMRHFVESYTHVRGTGTSADFSTFNTVIRANVSKVQTMTAEAIALDDQTLIGQFINMLDDVLAAGSDSTLSACRADLALHYHGQEA